MTEQTQTAQVEYIVTHDQARQKFIALGWWTTLGHSVVPALSVYSGEQRLDAEFYAADVVLAQTTIAGSKFETTTVKQVTEPIYYPGRFKRIYAKDRTSGTPFLTASEMLHFRPTSDEFLANNTAAVRICAVNPGSLLVTRSGTVGRCVIVGKNLSRFAITDDALRVKAKNVPIGYLYAFLSTWMGQILIAKDQYGSAIKHLEPQHIESVPLPLVPQNEQASVHAEIMRAYALRDEANDLLDQADEMLHQELGLPRFDPNLVQFLPTPPRPESNRPALPHPKAFTVRAPQLEERLDASYHVPIAKTAIVLLGTAKYELNRLADVAKDICVAPRFKRIYVPQQHGVPLLQGSHLPEMRPYNLKYISRAHQRGLERWIIRQGWVLVTCSGTIGRVGLVSSWQDQWAASQHLLRIVPDKEKAHPGYIAVFLMTPYGYHQLQSKIYGGVVDEITEDDTKNIWVPNAPLEIQTAIGALAVEAYEKKDEATAIEEVAIHRLEALLQKRNNP